MFTSDETPEVRDALHFALETAVEELGDTVGVVGYGYAELFKDADLDKPRDLWVPSEVIPFSNILTDAGDLYIANRVAGLAATAANGMKLGTGGATSPSKAGAGAAIVTYINPSSSAFDGGYPQIENLGTTLGVNAKFKASWAVGVATNPSISEASIVNDQANTSTGSTAPNTYARTQVVINKGANDSLSLTWNWKFLGA